MSRIMKLALAALFAATAVSAMMSATASAFHPLFLSLSGKELLFSSEGEDPLLNNPLRGEQVGLSASITCEKVFIHGFVQNLSTLAHKILFHLKGKCLQKIGSGANETCSEPILTKLILAELGLLSSSRKLVVVLLRPSSGTVLAEINCGGHSTQIGGVIVGEIPERNAQGAQQINVRGEEIEVAFETINFSNHQSITEIFLLNIQMTKQELTVSGFIGGPASQEGTGALQSDGKIEITTTKL